MEQEPSTAPTRKVRFAPKIPSRKAPKPAEPKNELVEDAEAAQTRDLLRRINEGSGRGKPKVDKKSAPVQVAFGNGSASSFMRSYGTPKSSASRSQDGGNVSGQNREKYYKEPWDYYTNYPATLPLRRPYSGNPVLLDEEEFGEGSANTTYDEDCINAAEELGLMDENEEARMLFLQLPASLPLVKRSAMAETAEIANSSKPSRSVGHLEKGCSLEELPPGFMGKLQVYKSGKIKLRLGDTLYDVSPGSECVFAQDVFAINTEEKHCCIIGEISKRAIVTPDVDSLLCCTADLD